MDYNKSVGKTSMNPGISKKTIYISLGVFLFAILVALGGLRAWRAWTTIQYSGEIVEVKNGGFLVKNDKGAEKLISTDKETLIRKGRNPAEEDPQVGDYVIAVGSAGEKDSIKADVIRILDAPPPLKKPKK